MANIFLSSDYEYCLRICQYNFSYVANTSLFEGNILRFKSLAAEQIFKHSQEREDASTSEDSESSVRMLFYAIEAAQNAREIYDENQVGQGQNIYGLALQDF